jgi:hypothetical protein
MIDDDHDDLGSAPEPKPDTVLVPVRLGDGISTRDETAEVEAEHARQWDARLWSDKPPL